MDLWTHIKFGSDCYAATEGTSCLEPARMPREPPLAARCRVHPLAVKKLLVSTVADPHAEESAAVLQRKLTALPPPVTRLETLVLRGMTAELWEHFEPAERAGVPAKQPRLVRDAQRYLETHYAEHVTITDMSRSLGCSRAQLTRAFRSFLAVSVHGYLTEIRARHAVHALHSSTEKVEAVALMVGYKSKKDLYRTIRAMTGVTPKRVHVQRASG